MDQDTEHKHLSCASSAEAHEVATDHVGWMLDHGYSTIDIVHALYPLSDPEILRLFTPSIDKTVRVIADAWIGLQA